MSNYEAQKKYLEKRSQLRVWMETDKYEKLKKITKEKGESIYSIINKFVDDYLKRAGE